MCVIQCSSLYWACLSHTSISVEYCLHNLSIHNAEFNLTPVGCHAKYLNRRRLREGIWYYYKFYRITNEFMYTRSTLFEDNLPLSLSHSLSLSLITFLGNASLQAIGVLVCLHSLHMHDNIRLTHNQGTLGSERRHITSPHGNNNDINNKINNNNNHITILHSHRTHNTQQ